MQFLRCFIYRSKDVSIESTKMYNLSQVVSTVARQHPAEVVTAHHLSQNDFAYIMETLMNPFYERMKIHMQKGEEEMVQKRPVICIGAQVSTNKIVGYRT